jgi:hypothetical protein
MALESLPAAMENGQEGPEMDCSSGMHCMRDQADGIAGLRPQHIAQKRPSKHNVCAEMLLFVGSPSDCSTQVPQVGYA